MPYVRRAAVLLEAVLHGRGMSHETREPSLRLVLLDRALSNVDFVRRATLFDRENNVCVRSSAKYGLYWPVLIAWAAFSNVYGLQQSKRASFWPQTERVTDGLDVLLLCNALSS